jgi:hypothetical protein
MAAARNLTTEQLSTRGSIAVNTRWARTGAAEREASGQRGQAGLRARLAREIDPDGTLGPAELAKRTENAYQAHMKRLAFASSKARAARKAGNGTA